MSEYPDMTQNELFFLRRKGEIIQEVQYYDGADDYSCRAIVIREDGQLARLTTPTVMPTLLGGVFTEKRDIALCKTHLLRFEGEKKP